MSSPLPPVPGPISTDKQGRLTPPWQAWFLQLYQYLSAPQSGGGGIVPISRAVNTTLPLTGGGTLGADLTLGVNTFGASNSGIVTASGGDPTYFLSADTTWKVPPSTLTVGTTTVSGATDTYILYNNAGTLGNYGLTGTGTTAVMQTAPTLTGAVTINAPASGTGASLTVNSATGWQGIQCNSTVQVTGPNSITNANQNVNQTQLLFHGYAAEFVSINGSAGTDQKVWSNYADGSGNYNYRIENDALTATYTYMKVARSGYSGTFSSHQPIVSFPIGYGNVTISSTITAGVYQLAVSAGTVAGFSNGVFLSAGSNTSDSALNIVNGANSAVFFNIRGDGKTVMGPCLTANTTTFTVTGSASSTAPAATFGGTANNYITATDGAGMTAVVQTATGLGAVQIGASSNHAVFINSNNTTRLVISSAGNVTVKAPASGSSLTIEAGTTAVQPLLFTAGTNLTTATAGSVEYDGSVGYFTSIASNRAVWMAENVAVSTTTYQLANQTAAQKMLNTSTLGALTLAVGTYEFECGFALSALNTATSSVFGWTLAGAATKTVAWMSHATSGTITTPQPAYVTFNTAANAAIVPANTTGVGTAYITGIIRVTVAGTVVPQISTNTGATAALVAVNSYFKVRQVSGGTGIIAVGNWT